MTKSWMPELTIAAQTDPGCDPAKAVNEDAYVTCRAACGTLLAVCDGMGGHDGGRVASTTAVQVLQSLIETAPADGASSRFLRTVIETAGRAVYALAPNTDDEYRPGSTCVALLFTRNIGIVAHVGDSRAYRLSKGKFERLTADHSLINDLVLAGVMTPQDAVNHPDAHRITRALGMTPQVVVDVREVNDLDAHDRFLLCSDGLTDLVTDDEIARIMSASNREELQAACSKLVDLAKERGGHDNVTAVMAQVEQLGPDATIQHESKGGECSATDVMALPSAPSTPIQPTVLLEPPRNAVAPTIVEPALKPPLMTETQPIAVPASPATLPKAAPASSATLPNVPASSATLPNITHASRLTAEPWSVRGSALSAPRSSAKWVLLAAAISGLVIVGLLIWALVH